MLNKLQQAATSKVLYRRGNSGSRTDQPPYEFRRALPWAAFVAMLFWLNYSGRATLSPLLVSVEHDLNVGHAAATSLLFMQSLGFCIAQFMCGFFLSRIRPCRMTAFSLTFSGLAFLLMPLAHSLEIARPIFFAFGFFAGFYFPAAMSTLSSLVYPEDWGKAVAVHEFAPNVGFICIPLVAQALLLALPWQGVFFAVGLSLLCGGLAFAAFGRGGRAYAAPPSFRGVHDIVASPAAWALMSLLAISCIGEFSVYSILQVYLVQDVHFSPAGANMAIAAARVLTPAAVVIGGVIADRKNPYIVLAGGLILHAVALTLMCLPSRFTALPGMGLQAFSIALLFPSLFKVMALAFPADRQALVMSLTMPLASLISAGIIPMFLGWCGETWNFRTGLAVIGAASLFSLLSVRILRRCGSGKNSEPESD